MGRILLAIAGLLGLSDFACTDVRHLGGDAAEDDGAEGSGDVTYRDEAPGDAAEDALPDGDDGDADGESAADGDTADADPDGDAADVDPDGEGDGDAEGDAYPYDVVHPPSVCGDGTVDPGEECDDRNRMNGDGCDWLCRLGDGSFTYPPLDPTVPDLVVDGDPVPVTTIDETDIWAFGDGFPFCGGLHLAWTGRFFGLAYNVDQPYFGVHVRFLNADGTEAHAVWRHDTPWEMWDHALAWSGTELALFSGNARDGIALSRFSDDGDELAAMSPIRGPDPRDPSVVVVQHLSHAAWSGDRYLVVSPWDYPFWSLETFGPAGEMLGTTLLSPGREARSCVRSLPLAGGWAVTDGWQLAIVDTSLSVTGYSGQVGAAWPGSTSEPVEGARVVDVGDGLVVVWMAGSGTGWDWTWALWMAGMSYDGDPTWPPRPIVVGIDCVRDGGGGPGMSPGWSGWSTAYGPAGIVVVAWTDTDGETIPGGELLVINTDRWGNVVSGPVSLLGEGVTTAHGYALDIAASDSGYGIVTVEDGPISTTGRIVYRHFRPAE